MQRGQSMGRNHSSSNSNDEAGAGAVAPQHDTSRSCPDSGVNYGTPSPRGQRKDALIHSYMMQQQQQQQPPRQEQAFTSRRRRSSPFFNMLHRRTGENANGNFVQSHESIIGEHSTGSRLRKGNNRLLLPPHFKSLPPRMDAWRMLTVSSCVAVSSISQTFLAGTASAGAGSSNYFLSAFSNWDKLALSTSILTFVFSLVMTCAMRYSSVATKSLFSTHHDDDSTTGQRRRRRRRKSLVSQFLLPMFTPEFVVLTILLLLWICSMPVIVNGNAYYNSSQEGSRGLPLAMAGYDIWNANLFYSSWISSLLCGYLWIEVLTLHDYQHEERCAEGAPVIDAQSSNTFTKRWLFLLCTALITMSSSISTYTSPVCQGKILKSTSYCRLAWVGIIAGGVLQLFITLCVGIFYLLSHTTSRTENDDSGESMSAWLSITERTLLARAAAVLSCILQIVNTAVLTSPVGGGPGSVSGTLYFACWLGLGLSLELCLRYLDVYNKNNSRPSDNSENTGRSTSDDVTVYEDTDAEEDSDRIFVKSAISDEENTNRRIRALTEKTKAPPVTREPSVASSTERCNPVGFANISQRTPSFNDSTPSMDPDGVLGVSYFTNITMNSRTEHDSVDKQQSKQVPVTRLKDPDETNDLASQTRQRQRNEMAKPGVAQRVASVKRMSSNGSHRSSKHNNLSPVTETHAEDASPPDDSPETIIGNFPPIHQAGNNDRVISTLGHDTRPGQQQRKHPVGDTRKVTTGPPNLVASTRVSMNRSRENPVPSSYPIANKGSQSMSSRRSTTQPQQKPVVLVSALSETQRYSRSNSSGRSKSPKTMTSNITESSASGSGSNPPLTISDGLSSPEDLSDDDNIKKIFASNENRRISPQQQHPPPPPVFPSRNSPPMQSISTSIRGHGESDTIMSEPTLDAGLVDSIGTPSPKPKSVGKGTRSQQGSHHHHHDSSSSITSYEKKESDDTNLLTRKHSHSSNETLPSNEGQTGVKAVDDIVAAALAYAEMTHSVAANSRGGGGGGGGATTARGGSSSATSSQHHPIASTTSQSRQKKKKSSMGSKTTTPRETISNNVATPQESPSSLHSYYSKKLLSGTSQQQQSILPPSHSLSGPPFISSSTTTPLEELLMKAFSQVPQHGGHTTTNAAELNPLNHYPHQQQQQQQQQQQTPPQRSVKSAAPSLKSGMSMQSVYSRDETEFSAQHAGNYDC